MLSDSPPERDLEWTEAGVTGAWRFQQRLHRIATEAMASLPPIDAPKPSDFPAAATELRRAAHKTIAGVSTDIEAFHFNKAVARLYELANAIGGFDAGRDSDDEASRWALRETLEIFVRLIGPMTPHLAEELWLALGHTTLLADAGWPAAEDALLVDDTVTVAVQLNGKLRGTIQLAKDTAKDTAEQTALALPEIVRGLDGKTPKRVIVVPNRIVNVVV
jgi:leucyl-tRNA synthetase